MSTTNAVQLADWFDAHAGRLVLYARNWLDRAAAEDVVQEVFLTLAAKSPPTDPAAWLFRAVRNAAISQQRSRNRRDRRERIVAEARLPWFEARADDLIDAATAQEVLAALPAEQREIVLLRIWGGLTLAEASAVTGEPLSTLFSRYQSALAAVRQKLEASCRPKTP